MCENKIESNDYLNIRRPEIPEFFFSNDLLFMQIDIDYDIIGKSLSKIF